MFSYNFSRRCRRFYLSLPVRVWFRGWVETRRSSRERVVATEDTFTDNISSGGCHFSLSHKPKVGTGAVMEITVPMPWAGGKESKIHCLGRVIRVEEGQNNHRVGVATTIDNYQIAATAEHRRVKDCFRPHAEN